MAIHPQCRVALRRARELTGPTAPASVEAYRRQEGRLTVLAGSPPAVDAVVDRTLPTDAGPVPVRCYRPRGAVGTPPLLVYLHGGGWSTGSVETADYRARALADGGGCVVISVDYRLAPEHRFPAGLTDADAVTRWAADHASELGADGSRLAIGGDSAGGNLAAAVALLARDRGGPPLALQLLLVPATIRAASFPSRRGPMRGWGVSAQASERGWANYLRHPFDALNPLVSPLLAHDLGGVAPACLVTAEFDPLRDEGFAYAARLRAAGVPVCHHHYERMVHSFLDFTALVDDARRALDRCGRELRRAFAAAHADGSPPSASGLSGRRAARGIAAAAGAGDD